MSQDSLGDQVLPFRLDGQDVRGRVARLDATAHAIIAAHDYPGPVARLVGELVALAALLGSMMKVEAGILTIQAKPRGPVPLLVADYHSGGQIRAYAEVDEAKLSRLGKAPSFHALTGAGGYLALTLDQGPDMERYQGIVPLEGDSLAECAADYFAASEQLPTRVKLAADKDEDGRWHAGAIMVQYLPHGDEEPAAPRAATFGEKDLEAFSRAAILMDSTKREELLHLLAADLLYRLYHEAGVRVFDAQPLAFGCRCARERIGAVLAQYDKADLANMADNQGRITVTCQFCNTDYVFAA